MPSDAAMQYEEVDSKSIQGPVEALARQSMLIGAFYLRKKISEQFRMIRVVKLGSLTTAANKSQSSTPIPKFFRCRRTAMRRLKKTVEIAVMADKVRSTLGPSSVARYSGVRLDGSTGVAMFKTEISSKTEKRSGQNDLTTTAACLARQAPQCF